MQYYGLEMHRFTGVVFLKPSMFSHAARIQRIV